VIALLLVIIGVLIGALWSPRIGSILIAVSLAIFSYRDFGKMRTIEKVMVLALFVSLITVALALPRR
jgi:hypothetical protein